MSEKYDPEVITHKPKMNLMVSPCSPDWTNTPIVLHGEATIMAKRKGLN